MVKEVNIIGLGETAKQFNGKGLTIGVNDAAHKWGLKLDYLVLQDDPTNFSFERFVNIIEHPPKEYVYTNQPQWRLHFLRQVKLIEVKSKSLDSTFFALQLATALGLILDYKVINIFGADFYNHAELSKKIPEIINQYNIGIQNAKELCGITVRVPKQSALAKCQNVTLID